MFTGIIEKTVRVIGVAEGAGFRRLTIASNWDDVRDGESVAVNGVCLTVADRSPGELGFDVIPETLSRTNLGLLEPGDGVHVERSLRIGDRIDGHFVQGHVDGPARLLRLASDEKECRLVLETTGELARYIIPKGSVTLDGVSLTIADVMGTVFEVALIPTTLRLTELGRRPVGWPYNLEADILSKTVVAHLERHRRPTEDNTGETPTTG
jgi:riboflavin synthase